MNRDRVSKRRVVVQVALGFFSAIGVVVACDSDGMPIAGDAGATGPSAHDAASDDGGIHRDSQVAYALVAANAAVLEQSATAEAKAKDPLVKDFARLLMRDHGAATERTRAVAKQKELGLADSAISQKFTEDAEELATRFAQRDDASFDKAYIEGQIILQLMMRSLIDNTLRPAVVEPDLAAVLSELRARIAEHIDRGHEVHAALTGGTTKNGDGVSQSDSNVPPHDGGTAAHDAGVAVH